MPREPKPNPITRDHEFYAAILDELRTLNAHFGGAEPSGPAVADGLTVTEQQPADRDEWVPDPGPLDCPDCGRMFTSQSGLSRHRQAKHEEG